MNILLGRQSILDKEQNVVAFELLFRSIDNSPINCDIEATASVVSNTLSMMSIDNVLGNKRGFVNIGIDILRIGLLDIMPPKRFVIEILETQTPNEELIQFIREFRKKNYLFALDDFIINDEQLRHWEPVLREVQIVKVDVLDTSVEDLKRKTALLKKYPVALLAEKVETKEMFNTCLALGYQYYQGYFFTKPVIIKGQGLSPSIQGILSVIKTIQKDEDLSIIEKTLKLYPELIISLLKIVNSSSVSPIQEITSIKQALALLGKKALSQWLILLLYSQKNMSSHSTIQNDPLFLTASQRGKTMELLLISTTPNASRALKDEAFLIGLLSLCDTLLHIPLKELIKELHVSDTIALALLAEKGKLGELLTLTKSLEMCNNVDVIVNQAETLSLTPDILNQVSYTALKFSKELAEQF